MKKHQVMASIGTLALLANLLVPGLAFGAATADQAGTADIACSGVAPSFSLSPAASFNFSPLGTGTPIYASYSAQNAFNNPDAAGLSVADVTDFIQVNDTRDPSSSAVGCNGGLTLALTVADGLDADGVYFDASTDPLGDFIPLTSLYAVSSDDTCPAGNTHNNNICFDAAALCGEGVGSPATTCNEAVDGGSTAIDYTGTGFATIGTYTADADSVLGLNVNTPASRSLFAFANDDELYGKAGVGTSFAVAIPAAQESGTYVVKLVYTLTGL